MGSLYEIHGQISRNSTRLLLLKINKRAFVWFEKLRSLTGDISCSILLRSNKVLR
jgi:hypothetical protein